MRKYQLPVALAALLVAGAVVRAAAAADPAQMARDYAPRVVLHPEERYGLANVGYFMSKFKLVLSTPLKKHYFNVTPQNIHRVVQKGWVRTYTTTHPRWKDNWWFESKDGCEWKTESAACDAAYLRAKDPVATYASSVIPEVYWRAVDRKAKGKVYTVIQYFFLLILNDAQNKHDGEQESSVVVVDKAAYEEAGDDPLKKRAAVSQILMAGHYRHTAFARDDLLKHQDSVFVTGTAHYRHVMSLGGHGGYLFVPESGRHEANLKCFEYIRASSKRYDSWTAPARLVQVGDSTPWIKYVGRWGRRYGLLPQLPLTLRFSVKPVAHCEGLLGTGWLKSRFMAIMSAPFGPKFIHEPVWNWRNFPRAPGETPKAWR